MANRRVTDLIQIPAIASGDKIHIVDVSDTTGSLSGTSKYMTAAQIQSYAADGIITLTGVTYNDVSQVLTLSMSDASILQATITGITNDHKVKISSTDTTEGFLTDSIQGGDGIELNTVNPLGDEKIRIDLDFTGLTQSSISATDLLMFYDQGTGNVVSVPYSAMSTTFDGGSISNPTTFTDTVEICSSTLKVATISACTEMVRFQSPITIGDNIITGDTITVGSGNTHNGDGGLTAGRDNTVSGIGQGTFGQNNISSGNYSLVVGDTNEATDDNNFVGGSGNTVSQDLNFVWGKGNDSVGQSFIFGENNFAKTSNAFVTGKENRVQGNNGFATGTYVDVQGHSSFGGGRGESGTPNWVNGNYSFSFQRVDSGATKGVYSNQAVILGGKNNQLTSAAENSVILGMEDFVGASPNTVYMNNAQVIGALTVSGKSLTTFIDDVIGANTGNTYVTGATYSRNDGELTITRNDASSVVITGFTTETDINSLQSVTYTDPTNPTLTFNMSTSLPLTVSGVTGIYLSDVDLVGDTLSFTRSDGEVFYQSLGSFATDTYAISAGLVSGSTLRITMSDGDFVNADLSGLYDALLDTNTYVTGGTYTASAGTITFTNSTGGTIDVTGFDVLDSMVTGGTYSNGTATFTNNDGGTFQVSGFYTGGTEGSSSSFILTGNGNTSLVSLATGTTYTMASTCEYGFIAGGENHTMSSSTNRGAILGGNANVITGNAGENGILAGGSNTIDTSTHSVILGGGGNDIENISTYSGIIAGHDNTINGKQRSVILGGSNITASANDTVFVPQLNIGMFTTGSSVSSLGIDANGFVVTGATAGGGSFWSEEGTGNLAIKDTKGFGTSITGTSDYSIMGGGMNHKLFNSTRSGIIGGELNQITGGTRNFVGGGYDNDINSGAAQSAIVGGSYHNIETNNSGILGGTLNEIEDQAHRSAIAGGQNNHIYGNTPNCFIGGGINNYINSSSTSSAIIGGDACDIDGDSDWSAIASGEDHRVHNDSGWAFIGGGKAADIDNSKYAAIVGGQNNQVYNVSDYSVVIGGTGHNITGATRSVILGGSNITATENNTAYVDKLNIKTVGGGTSVTNLGIDANGQVVSGTTGGGSSSMSDEAKVFSWFMNAT